MMLSLAALSNHGAWEIALVIGLVAALAVAGLLWILIQTVDDIERSARGLLEVAGKVAGNTAHIPAARRHRPGPERDRRRGRRPGWLHERPY